MCGVTFHSSILPHASLILAQCKAEKRKKDDEIALKQTNKQNKIKLELNPTFFCFFRDREAFPEAECCFVRKSDPELCENNMLKRPPPLHVIHKMPINLNLRQINSHLTLCLPV